VIVGQVYLLSLPLGPVRVAGSNVSLMQSV